MSTNRIKSFNKRPKKKMEVNLSEAVGVFGEFLPKIAGIAISLTFITYFLGWREESSYYQALGAPWVLSLIPRFTFMNVSSGGVMAISV